MKQRNPLLNLPAGRALLELPTHVRAPLERVMRELRAQANDLAETSWRKRKGPMAAYWRATSTYAGHVARALAMGAREATLAPTDPPRRRQDRSRACLDCGGAGHRPRAGWHPVAVFECETCHGTGTEIVERRATGRIDAVRIDPPLHAVECEDCHGSGTVLAHGDYAARISCPSCGGGGTVLEPLVRADDMPRQLPIAALLDVLQAGPPETVGYGDVGAPAFQHGWRAALDHVWNHLQVAALLEPGARQEAPPAAPSAAPDPVPLLVDACSMAADWLAPDAVSLGRAAGRIADYCAQHALEACQETAVTIVRNKLVHAIAAARPHMQAGA